MSNCGPPTSRPISLRRASISPCGSANSADESLIARRLHTLRVVVVGAPAYFVERGWPKHPNDLEQHACILRAGADVIDQMAVSHRRPAPVGQSARPLSFEQRRVDPRGRERRHVALPGCRCGRSASSLAQGALAIVLPEFETDGMPIQLVWPPTRAPLERVRRFVDFLASSLKTDLL